jgi:hypothetical protein
MSFGGIPPTSPQHVHLCVHWVCVLFFVGLIYSQWQTRWLCGVRLHTNFWFPLHVAPGVFASRFRQALWKGVANFHRLSTTCWGGSDENTEVSYGGVGVAWNDPPSPLGSELVKWSMAAVAGRVQSQYHQTTKRSSTRPNT